ncbi:MAG TPA: hypothetical protein DCL35_06225 [Candidatus Omnitrophica bacterium]|nr:hypothetical protein [Candidatus Omnitrophota bacterium]
MATAKSIAITMAVNIFGVADGLRPRAVMLAKLEATSTAIGPNIHRLKISTSDIFLSISGLGSNC